MLSDSQSQNSLSNYWCNHTQQVCRGKNIIIKHKFDDFQLFTVMTYIAILRHCQDWREIQVSIIYILTVLIVRTPDLITGSCNLLLSGPQYGFFKKQKHVQKLVEIFKWY